MKSIVPYVRRKILSGCHIVFSGVFPTNQPAQQSRAHRAAVAMGAVVQADFVARGGVGGGAATTHVVAARRGTTKVNAARAQRGGVHVVHTDWLWACADRWEWVEERLFPLTQAASAGCDSPAAKRKSPDGEEEEVVAAGKRAKTDASSSSAEERAAAVVGTERRFSDSYNPLYALSSEDIASMDREVEQTCNAADDDDDDDDDREDREVEEKLRQRVLSGSDELDSSSADSLSSDFPKGWKRQECGSTARTDVRTMDDNSEEEEEEDGDSDGSMDEMAAAIEKEFLS